MKAGMMKKQRNLSTKISDDSKRLWSDLPCELLERIAEHLSLLDLLSFRSVCKEWQLACSRASGGHDSATPKLLWLLVYDNGRNCSLQDFSSGKIYTICIPELDGATCIASIGGWLLIFRNGSLFFFCPFSRAKLDLPKFPHEELLDPVATFSSTPTSPDCIICVGTKTTSTKFELNVLRRGANKWTKYEYDHQGALARAFTCAILFNEMLYFLKESKAMTFSLEDEKWTAYKAVPCDSIVGSPPTLPVMIRSIDARYRPKNCDSASICGAMVLGSNGITDFIHNEDFPAEKEGNNLIHKKAVWIEPRFFQLPPNQSWSI